MRALGSLVMAAMLLAGCSTLERNAVPPEMVGDTSMPGHPDIRAVAGNEDEAMQRDLALSFQQDSAADFPPGPDGVTRYPLLAISGGGANGAFGAGFGSPASAVAAAEPVFGFREGRAFLAQPLPERQHHR